MKTYPRTRRDVPRQRWSPKRIAVGAIDLAAFWPAWKRSEIVGWVKRFYLAADHWLTKHSTGLFIAVAIVAAMLALWKGPKRQAARSQGISFKNRFKREDDARKTLAQVLGGLFVLFGLYTSIQTVNLQQEGQITDRYTKAIDQLGAVLPGDKVDANGNPRINLEVRLGGIYALERITHDSPEDQGTIMEVLSAYVRENSPVVPASQKNEASKAEKSSAPSKSPDPSAGPKPRADIQAILTVIGRRDISNNFVLQLSSQDRPAYLSGAHLINARLNGADLTGADLSKADLTAANLNDGAHLNGADLTGANLTGAYLNGADLTDGAHLNGANLNGAHLNGAHLTGADLTGADLSEADFSGALGLTQQQLDMACASKAVILPANLHQPPSCK